MALANEIKIAREEIKRALSACDSLAALAARMPAAPARVAALRELGAARLDLTACERRLSEMAADLTPVNPHSPAQLRAAHKSAEHFAAAHAHLTPRGKP